MNQVELSDQESLRSHIMDCRVLFPTLSSIRIFLNILHLFEQKYNKLSNSERIDFLHDLYLISGAE
jgi:hypothetical protein